MLPINNNYMTNTINKRGENIDSLKLKEMENINFQ